MANPLPLFAINMSNIFAVHIKYYFVDPKALAFVTCLKDDDGENWGPFGFSIFVLRL